MIYTFLEDNGYASSLQTLQHEADYAYILPRIKNGEWETVLQLLSHIRVAPDLLYELYEQIIFELVEEGDGKIGLVLLQQPGVQSLKESHLDQVKKLEVLCKQKEIDMQVVYDQEEKGDRQERRERLAALFREALRIFDEDNEQFGMFKLLAVGQQDDESDEVPLEPRHKAKKTTKEAEEEVDIKNIRIRKPYEVLGIVDKNKEKLDSNKEIE